jgi:DNA-binding NarL/FixJ family response regulator
MSLIKVAIADDHDLMREGIVKLIEDAQCTVVVQARNGRELLEKIPTAAPDVVLMDINMPELDGIQTTLELGKAHPEVKTIALTALEDETSTIRMLRAGARAYLLKSASAQELNQAISDVYTRGYHFSELVSGRLIHSLNHGYESHDTVLSLSLTQREIEFLQHLCSELTNKEIADRMCVSPRTSEGWSKNLCERLGVKSRVGLVLFAFRNNLIH